MFDEQQEAEGSDEDLPSLVDNEDNIAEFIYDYFDHQPISTLQSKTTKITTKKAAKLEEEEKKEEVKAGD